ncbi:MAG: GAF domain-containing protein [Candidatus Adiutrix sp.]|jgi:signal transduction histidine kinase|nr:GAF domain-containing protein [Candidatus Adiutrix sp.]
MPPASILPELARLKDLEAKLDIYKRTLTEIYRQYDQKLEELSLVRRLGDALRSIKGLEALARSLLENVAQEAAIDRLTLMLAENQTTTDQDRPRLLIRAAYWADREIFSFFEAAQAVPWSPNFPGEPAVAPDLTTPLTILSAAPAFDPLGRPGDQARSLVFLPLLASHRLLGLLALSRPAGRPFTPEDERLLTIMGDQAGAALANVLLFDDLKQVNQRLVESESRARQVSNHLQRLLETANDAILTLNDRGLITYANRKAAQWGRTRETLAGREFRQFLADPDHLPGWPPGAPPPADQVFEAVLLDASGQPRDVILSTSQVVEGDEESGSAGGIGAAYAAWMVLVTDMTERKHLERQLIHSEKLASIGLLAAGVAHEVGNPLSAISGYAQILEAGAESEAERREYLAAILDQTGRIQKILRELLDYSRPSTGQATVLDLAEALPRTLDMIRAQRVFRNVDLELDLDLGHRPHLVTMNPDHLAQITIIIALNAAQAMAGRGRFKVTLGKKNPGRVKISFSDSGPGIPPEIISRLFDPFFTTKSPGEGTGLGLSICQRLVDGYQGRIEIHSRPDQGATFVITLPESA